MIANGGKLSSKWCCPNVSLKIQGCACTTDLFAIPLGGCDVVLGAQWLITLSLILWDFKNLRMEFIVGDQSFCVSNIKPQTNDGEQVSSFQMARLLQHEHYGVVLQLLQSTIPTVSIESQLLSANQQSTLQAVLSPFDTVFETLSILPHSRLQDHRIPLIEGSKPPSTRPYRYGPF